MRRENLPEQKKNSSFVVAVFQSIMIISIMVVLIISIVLTTSCNGLTIIEDNEQGTLVVGFAKEYKTSLAKNANLEANSAYAANAYAANAYSANAYSANAYSANAYSANTYSRDVPDTNLFILSIKKIAGDLVYKGLYSERPNELKLNTGSYDFEIYSREFAGPEFDAPRYYDSGTVVITAGKTTSVSFLCRQSNGAMRLGFTSAFKTRFSGYVVEIEDSKGSALYSYTESRFLYLNPGDVFIRLKLNNSSSGSNSGGSGAEDSFLVTRKSIAAMEMVTVNLHSSVSGGDSGGDPGSENPHGDSKVFTGILMDTSSVWSSQDIVVGERRDGSTKDLALTVDEIAGFVGAKGVWVSGYLVGYLTTGSLISLAPFETETNIAIAAISGEKNRDLCAGIALTAGAVRSALNLKDNPQNIGKKIYVKGTIAESYFGLKGVNSVTEFIIE